jgi:GNAT superfamily N-acetyltransferase
VTGPEAIVVNMYVDTDWRRRGVARALMSAILEWARATRVQRLVLHASAAGRPLYESLGFKPTNEMLFGGS